MTTMSRVMISMLAFVLLLVGGCKKSVEGEEAAWRANVAKITELKAKYPGFDTALEARKTSATAIYDAAASLDGDAKIDKLAEANSAIRKGFVSQLDGLDEKVKKLRESRVQATAKAGDGASQAAAKLAATDAEQTLARVEKTLAAGAKDEASADAVLDKVLTDLKTAQSAIDTVTKVDQDKKDDAKAKDEAKTAAETKAKEDADAKVAPWTCEFCQGSNPHDATNCASCGAPRPAAKK